GPSTVWPSWTARSSAGCRSAAVRSIAPTVRSSRSAPGRPGPLGRPPRPGQRVQLHIGPDPAGDRIPLQALAVDGGGWLATHPRATRRGTWMVDPAHWDGLPDGHTRATTVETVGPGRIAPAAKPA